MGLNVGFEHYLSRHGFAQNDIYIRRRCGRAKSWTRGKLSTTRPREKRLSFSPRVCESG